MIICWLSFEIKKKGFGFIQLYRDFYWITKQLAW